MLSPYLCFISFLYLDLYVPRNGTSISKGSFMRTKHLFVLIHIRNKGNVGTVRMFICVCLAHCLLCFLKPFGHLLGKDLPLVFLVCYVFLCFCHFWYRGSGVIFDYIES